MTVFFFYAGGGKGIKEKPGKARKKNMQGDEDEQEAAEETYYDAMKKDMTDRAARTKVQHYQHHLLCVSMTKRGSIQGQQALQYASI